MRNELFTVETIAELCDVNKETVRRWRKWGRNGVRLEATDPDAAEHTFTREALNRFMNANPKYLTEELRQALEESEEALPRHEPVPAGLEKNWAYTTLRDQRDLLRQQIRDLEREMARMEHEAGKDG